MLYAVTGDAWTSPDVSFSYVPDGTDTGGQTSSLFSKLDAVAPTDVWQREFARALQTWSNASALNFHEVADDGSPSELGNVQQGDSRFGDIRLAAHPLNGPLAFGYYPSAYWGIGGDIFLSTQYTFQLGATYDLYSVLLHESGHSLGLDHTPGTVMNANYQGVLTGLTADDIDGIQSIYGARQDDVFDLNGRNDSLASASVVDLDQNGDSRFEADLTNLDDTDYYSLVAPADADGNLLVSVDVSGLSLLAPEVSLYDASGALVGSTSVGDAYGTTATVQWAGVVAGETYTVMADGATADAFGMGAYRLDVDFGTAPGGPSGIDPDRFESNDSLLTATDLGRFNNHTEMGLTLHTTDDVDMFHFSARKSGSFRVTANFATASSTQVTLYDASMNVLAQTVGSSVEVALARGQDVFVGVQSLAAETDSYDLVFEKLGFSGLSVGAESVNLATAGQEVAQSEPDLYFATAGDEVIYKLRHGQSGTTPSLSGVWAHQASQAGTSAGQRLPGMRPGSAFRSVRTHATDDGISHRMRNFSPARVAVSALRNEAPIARARADRGRQTEIQNTDTAWQDALEHAFGDEAFGVVLMW